MILNLDEVRAWTDCTIWNQDRWEEEEQKSEKGGQAGEWQGMDQIQTTRSTGTVTRRELAMVLESSQRIGLGEKERGRQKCYNESRRDRSTIGLGCQRMGDCEEATSTTTVTNRIEVAKYIYTCSVAVLDKRNID